MTLHTYMPLIAVSRDCGPWGRFTYDWMLNYMIARTTPFAGFAASHVGVYGYVWGGHSFRATAGGIMNCMLFIDVTFPQAQIYRTDYGQRFPEWYCRFNPYRMRRWHGPYGDGSPFTDHNNAGHIGYRSIGEDMASVFRSGIAEQHYNINAPLHQAADASYPCELIARWHYTNRPAATIMSNANVYVEDGFLAASSISPSYQECYTNGSGFSMNASPRGELGAHDVTKGQVDLWLKGMQVTDGGGMGLHQQDYRPESGAGTMLFFGVGGTPIPPKDFDSPSPIISKIYAYTNSGEVIYGAMDLTGQWTNTYQTVWNDFPSNLVTKAREHVIFNTNGYWIFYAEYGAVSNVCYQWHWHAPHPFRYEASGSALLNEYAAGADRFVTNGFALTTNGFTYPIGNYTDASYADVPPRSHIRVTFINDTNQFGLFVSRGTNHLNEGSYLTRHIVVTGAGTSGANGTYDYDAFVSATWTNRSGGAYGIYAGNGYYHLTNASLELYTNSVVAGVWVTSLGADNAPTISYTGENGSSFTNVTLNPFRQGGLTFEAANPDRAASIYASNKVESTSFQFMVCVGETNVVFERVDDNTVSATCNGVTRTYTIGTAHTNAVDYRIALVEPSQNQSGGGSSQSGARAYAPKATIGKRQ